MQNSIYKIKYLLFLSWDWEAWCLTQSGGVYPERNTAWNKGRKCSHCLGAPNNLIRPCLGAVKESSALRILGIVGQKCIFTVCLSVLHTDITSSLMLFEGQAGEALGRSGSRSYPLPRRNKSVLRLPRNFPFHLFIHWFNQTSNTDTAGTSVWEIPI